MFKDGTDASDEMLVPSCDVHDALADAKKKTDEQRFNVKPAQLTRTCRPPPNPQQPSLAQHVQGDVTTQGHLRQFPILKEARDLVTRPVQSDDVQRSVAQIVLTRISRGDTPTFRPRFARIFPGLFGQLRFHVSPKSGNSSSLGSVPFSVRRSKANFVRIFFFPKTRYAAAALQERRQCVPLPGIVAGSFCIKKKKKSSQMRPVLPSCTPFHRCCV